jgi:hypothetical protein
MIPFIPDKNIQSERNENTNLQQRARAGHPPDSSKKDKPDRKQIVKSAFILRGICYQ